MQDELTPDFFEKNTSFSLKNDDKETTSMKVVEVKKITNSADNRSWGKPEYTPTREAFSVVFRGPEKTLLEQGSYQLAYANNQTLSNLFLVPIAKDEEGTYYEAVFN